MPTLGEEELLAPSHLIKYSPHSILQEFVWAFEILNRDDEVRESDVAPLFYERRNGLVSDLHLLPFDAVDRATALRRREAVYRIYRQAFSCDYVVITLGLIESWFDRLSGLHILQMPHFLRTEEALSRFEFRKIGYNDAHRTIQATIDCLDAAGSPKKYLVTTSPVPMARTFTATDVIIANAHSKALLRSVAGAITDSNDHVDYFPSYESVMLTKDESVWEADLIHVSAPFVNRIMARVLEVYAPHVEIGAQDWRDRVEKFQQTVQAGDVAAAQSLYSQLSCDPAVADDVGFHVAAATLKASTGDAGGARAHAGAACELAPEHSLKVLLAAAYDSLGERAKVEQLLSEVVEDVRAFPHWIGVHANRLDELRAVDAAIRLAEIARTAGLANAFALISLARRLLDRARHAQAIEALRAAVALEDDNAQAKFLLGRALLESGAPSEAVDYIRAALVLEPDAIGRRFFLTSALERSGDMEAACQEWRALVAEAPNDERATKGLADFLRRHHDQVDRTPPR